MSLPVVEQFAERFNESRRQMLQILDDQQRAVARRIPPICRRSWFAWGEDLARLPRFNRKLQIVGIQSLHGAVAVGAAELRRQPIHEAGLAATGRSVQKKDGCFESTSRVQRLGEILHGGPCGAVLRQWQKTLGRPGSTHRWLALGCKNHILIVVKRESPVKRRSPFPRACRIMV